MSHILRKLFPYANNKGADQPALPRSLISAFVVHWLDSIIPPVSISEISSLYLASVAEQAGLSQPWLQTPKTGFLVTRLIYHLMYRSMGLQGNRMTRCDFQTKLQIRLTPTV